MRTAEMMIWSAVVGSIGLIVLLAFADALYSRTRSSFNALVNLVGGWLFVALFSGLPGALFSPLAGPPLHVLQVIVGPLCASMASYGTSRWLTAQQRDRTMKTSMRLVSIACLAGAPLCLLLKYEFQLPASAALTVCSLGVLIWVGARAAQLGDRMAWGLTAGFVITLPLQLGMYWLALGSTHPSIGWQVAIAIAGLASLTVTAVMAWLRNRHAQQFRSENKSRRDRITQLYSSTVIVQKIIHAQRRLVRTRRDGALMAVMLFDAEQLSSQVGQYGLNEIYIHLARRMQRHTGVVNPAGRYYDRCFVVLMETMHSPKLIRTMGLRVASSLRRPIDVISLNGERIKVTADIGVGIVHMSRASKDVDQVLHEAQKVAEAARHMRSRAALLDPETRHAIPVESAELGRTWRAQRAQFAHLNHPATVPKTLRAPGRLRNRPA